MNDINRKGYLFSNNDLVRLLIPLVIEQLLSIMVGLVDTIMIAAVGESAVSAVSLVDSLNILLINIFGAFATGGAVVCGQFLGKKQQEKACNAADQLYLFTGVISVLIMALVYILRGWILGTVFGKIEPDVMSGASTYMMIVTASIPFIAIYNCGAAVFRTMGNSKISMIMSLVMNGINIVGNAIMIYGLKMGVVGAAVPTLVSRIVAAVVMYILIRNPKLLVHTSRVPVIKPCMDYIKKILYIGVPNGLEGSVFQLGKILVLSLVSTFGTASITANAVANNLATFQILPGMAIGLGLVTVISRCVGAGDYNQVRYYTRKLLMIEYVALFIINVLIFFVLPMVLGFYNLSEETYSYAYKIITFHGVMAIFIWPLSFSLTNTLRAANDVRFAMVITILSVIIVRVGASYLFADYFGMGVFGVWVAMVVDWVARSAGFVSRYLGHGWEKHRI